MKLSFFLLYSTKIVVFRHVEQPRNEQGKTFPRKMIPATLPQTRGEKYETHVSVMNAFYSIRGISGGNGAEREPFVLIKKLM